MSPLPEEKVEALAGARMAAIREALAVSCEECGGTGVSVQGTSYKGEEPELQYGPCHMCAFRAQALAPLVAGWLAEERERIVAAIEAVLVSDVRLDDITEAGAEAIRAALGGDA